MRGWKNKPLGAFWRIYDSIQCSDHRRDQIPEYGIPFRDYYLAGGQPLAKLLSFIFAGSNAGQPIGVVLIGMNRYSAIMKPLSHEKVHVKLSIKTRHPHHSSSPPPPSSSSSRRRRRRHHQQRKELKIPVQTNWTAHGTAIAIVVNWIVAAIQPLPILFDNNVTFVDMLTLSVTVVSCTFVRPSASTLRTYYQLVLG